MSGGGTTPDRDDVVDRMQRLLARVSRRRGVHHVVVGAADLDGAWEWSDARGHATPVGPPMRADIPVQLASVTKLYIAAVVLRLNEQGHLALDEPISRVLPPELAVGLHVLDGVDSTEMITPIHLLGHLSGLPDSLVERPPGASSLVEQVIAGGDRSWSLEEAVALARDRLTPHFPPSDPASPTARIRYSDTNFQLLMLVVEHVTGRPMDSVYEELLFRPLRLVHTWMPGATPLEPTGEPATVWSGTVPVDRPLAMRSFGDLYATVADALRFGRALFGGEVFADPATADLMRRPFRRFGFPRGFAALRSPSWPIEYGLGTMRFALTRALAGGRRFPELVGHTGSTGSWLWFAPRLRLVVAGTVDQTTAATVPFRAVPRALAGLPG